MATFLDTLGIVEFFLPLATFLFVLVILYAVLDKFKILGDSKSVKWLVSFSVSLLFLFSSKSLELVNLVTPWFAVFVVLTIFALLLFMTLGIKQDTLSAVATQPQVYWTIIIVGGILFVIALLNVFGNVLSPYGGDDGDGIGDDGQSRSSEALKTIVHPRILGLIFLMGIAALTATFLSKNM
ncbi:hypothetical protein K8R47_01310 [archaeon]|nr:hypothetical protein [archaeon]